MKGRTLSSSPEVILATCGFGLNAGWEFAQTPLYSDANRGARYLLWSRLHCTAGDVLILLVAYWVTALLFRDHLWPRRGWSPAAAFVGAGIGYTIFSEWLNISIRATWRYSHEMPQWLGIGLTPVLQWIVIPPLLVLLIRQRSFARDVGERSGSQGSVLEAGK